jgi:hypothetical protein
MASLTYWYCACLDDADAYSIIAKTKKEAVAQRAERNRDRLGDRYAPPEKRVIQYRDAFDLFDWCTGEGGGRSCGSLQ